MSLREEIITLNDVRSIEFCSSQARDRRVFYSYRHPTRILVFKCMDGRINLPLITGIPMGKLHPFRNIGGKFVLGDPYLGRLVQDAKESAMQVGHRTLALCTYHFSEGDTHRGCAGHSYDTESARRGALVLRDEFDEVFGASNETISAIVVGIETDTDTLIFCNKEGKELSMRDYVNASDDSVKEALYTHYRDIPAEILKDLLPLALGNRTHIKLTQQQERPVQELVHNENIIAVGRGFDWLHLINRALIIGPYGHTDGTWREAIRVAGNIVLANFQHNEDLRAGGALLLISAPYTNLGECGMASAKSRHLRRIAEQVLAPVWGELSMDTLVGITNMETMKFSTIE